MADQNQSNPYAAYGGTVEGATPNVPPTQAAPNQAAPTAPKAPATDPYAAYGGSLDTGKSSNDTMVDVGGGGGGGGDKEDSITAGFTDKIGKAASGLWELAKAQGSHIYGQLSQTEQDAAQGHFMRGAYDALKATILPDTESPVHHVIRGMAMDSLHSLKDAGSEGLDAIKEGYRVVTSKDAKERHEHVVQMKGHEAGVFLNQFKAVAPGLVESGEEMANPETKQHGLGGALGEAAMIAAPEVGGKVASKATELTGKALESFGMSKIGGLLKATNPRDFFYNADPRQAIIDEKISPRLGYEGVRDELETAQNDLENQVRQKLATSKTQDLDVVPVVKQTTDSTLNELANTRGFTSEQRTDLVNAIKDYRDNLLSAGFDPQTGQSVGTATKSRLGPDEVADFRRDIGKSTRWNRMDADPAISTWMNNYQKELYAKLNDMVESVEPGTKALNKRIQNAIGAIRLIDKQVPREAFTDVGLRRLGRKLEVGAGVEAIAQGHPVVGSAMLANRAMRSTPGRIITGRGAVAAGNVLKGGAPETAVGQAAQTVGRTAKAAMTAGGGAAASEVGQAAETQGIENWIPIQTSDGAQHLIHPEDLEEAKKRDPKLKVLNKSE